jgi:hypothetical protein
MSIVNRKIVLSLVTVALVAAPLGCAAPGDASDEAVASETADFSASSPNLMAALADNTHQGPTLDQVVTILTKVLDLTEGQVKKLRAFLQAQEDAYHRAHP